MNKLNSLFTKHKDVERNSIQGHEVTGKKSCAGHAGAGARPVFGPPVAGSGHRVCAGAQEGRTAPTPSVGTT